MSELYGTDGGLFSNRCRNGKSIWASIVNCARNLAIDEQSFISSFSKILSKDSNSFFWKDDAVGGGSVRINYKTKIIRTKIY